MATLDDIRNAGYDVNLAWEGNPDVYAISRAASQPDLTQPNYDSGMLNYLLDDPQTLADFLSGQMQPPAGGSA